MKSWIFLPILFLFQYFNLSAEGSLTQTLSQSNVISNGIGIGTVIAVVASWSRNKSIFWALFHGICGWFYVIYFLLTRGK